MALLAPSGVFGSGKLSLVTTLWGAMTGFREEYFQQYVVLNLAVHLSPSVFSYTQRWIFIS